MGRAVLAHGSPRMTQTNDNDARTWAMLCHVTALSGMVGVPLGHLIGPLVVWLIKKDEYPLVDDQGKESLNFQLSMTIYLIVSAILILVIIGIVLFIALLIADLVLVIIATVKANNGECYRYPMTIRFLK
jgi:uncharacterized Tic20 family protein